MKIFAFTSLALLLGACASTTAPIAAPVVGGATRDALGNYQVVTRGITYDLPPLSGIPVSNASGADLERLREPFNVGFGAKDTNVTLAAGLLNGTFVAGISGTPSASVPTATTAYSGVWGIVKTGATYNAAITLTANFGAGTLTGGAPAALDVNGTISGSSVSGTAIFQGTDTGDLTGGFYGPAASPTLGLTVVGPNLSGIIVAN